MFEENIKNITTESQKKTEKIPLHDIFKKNNFNYKFVIYIIFSLPKTGSCSLHNACSKISKENEVCLHFHSIIELINKFGDEISHYNIYEIISFLEKNTIHKRIYIFTSYREPYKRWISLYYHNILAYNKEISEELNTNIININDLDIEITESAIFWYNYLQDNFSINLANYNYNSKNGCLLLDYSEKINWFFTCVEDFDKFNLFLKSFNNLTNFEIMKDNINTIYKNQIENTDFDNYSKIQIYDCEKNILKFYKCKIYIKIL